MARQFPRLNAVPADHNIPAATWSLFNGHNSDSVEEERSFVAGSSIVIAVLNAGTFVSVTITDGVSEAHENLTGGSGIIVQTGGLGERIPYKIKVKAKNLTNKLTSLGAPLSVQVIVTTVAPSKPIPSFPRPPSPPKPPSTPPKQERFHIVQVNDFLRKIAQQYYGDGDKWRVIYDANKSIIGPNPNLIHPGQRLRIP